MRTLKVGPTTTYASADSTISAANGLLTCAWDRDGLSGCCACSYYYEDVDVRDGT